MMVRQAVLAVIAALFAATAGAGVEPYVPASPGVVLQRVPASSDPRVRRLEVLRRTFDRAPHDLQPAIQLAAAYLDYGRSTGDARYLGRALAVIEPWMRERPIPVPVLVLHATLLQSRHAFEASRAELVTILERDPRNAQASLTLATVEMVQADYAAANAACVHVAQIGGDLLAILCTAQLRALTGHAQQAYSLFELIEHPGDEVPPAIRAYVEGLMAETAARLGRSAEAERHFEAALLFAPGDDFLLASFADFLLDQHRPREARVLLADSRQSDTSFLRLTLAEAALHDSRAPRDIAEMKARFAALQQHGSNVYMREHAVFVLHVEHDSARALQIAEQNWNVQRAPQDMQIYLEAALAADQPQAAGPVMRLLSQSRLEDPAIDTLLRKVAAVTAPDDRLAMRAGPAP